jgi:hypothetical protein
MFSKIFGEKFRKTFPVLDFRTCPTSVPIPVLSPSPLVIPIPISVSVTALLVTETAHIIHVMKCTAIVTEKFSPESSFATATMFRKHSVVMTNKIVFQRSIFGCTYDSEYKRSPRTGQTNTRQFYARTHLYSRTCWKDVLK